MNDRIWWHLTRATGLVAWVALAASMATGGLIANRFIRAPATVRRTVGLHRHCAAIGLMLTAVHLGALLADSYVPFEILDLVVPFRAPWRPTALAWGIAGLDLLILVEATSLAHRRLSKRSWQLIHRCSALGFASATVHLLQAGSETSTAAIRGLVIVITTLIAFLHLGRLMRVRTGASPRREPREEPLASPADEAYC